jgi:hypothetical protein
MKPHIVQADSSQGHRKMEKVCAALPVQQRELISSDQGHTGCCSAGSRDLTRLGFSNWLEVGRWNEIVAAAQKAPQATRRPMLEQRARPLYFNPLGSKWIQYAPSFVQI